MKEFLDQLRENRLRAYAASPRDIREHYGIEQNVLAGGYGYRQILELVQNGADAILEAGDTGYGQCKEFRIEVLLDGSYLYVANTGAPFSNDGVDALLHSHSSPKRGNQIGRFGLGFKSLLRLGGKIDIISGNAAFGLDPERCRAELRSQFGVNDAPGLRIAWPLDQRRSELLRERFPWATTVVCAEVAADNFLEHLKVEIRDFPAEFLLFLPIDVTLVLDCGDDTERTLRRELDGHDIILCEGSVKSRWRVKEKSVSITDKRAKEDATHVHARDEVPLAWAIPIDSKREEAGRFWAFFPTQTPTYIPGILNAPWKLNSDRNAIIPGDWNAALMEEAAALVAEALPQLQSDADPGCILDAFPRQLDRADVDAVPLVKALWAHLKVNPLIPDSEGQLRSASELWMHPRNNADLAQSWRDLADQEYRRQMVHPTCLEGQRGSRLKALAEQLVPSGSAVQTCPNLRQRDIREWFGSIASTDEAKAISVLKLAEAYKDDCKQIEWEQIRKGLAIIPTVASQLVPSDQAVIAPDGADVPDGRHAVVEWLLKNVETKRLLTEILGVRPLNDSMWGDVLRNKMPQQQYWEQPSDDRWRAFWRLLRAAPENVCESYISSNESSICVRRRDGKWVLIDETLFPGRIIDATDAVNNHLLVDDEFHGPDTDLLHKLGITDYPDTIYDVRRFDRRRFDQLTEWLNYWRSYYKDKIDDRPRWELLEPFSLRLPRGWPLLSQSTEAANAKLTKCFMTALGTGSFELSVWFGHSTQDHYRSIQVTHPLLWLLLKHGSVTIGKRSIGLASVISHLQEPVMSRISDWQMMQSLLERLQSAEPQVTDSSDHVHALWQALVETLVTADMLDGESLRELWSGMARDNFVPSFLPRSGSEVPLAEIFVTSSSDLARRARANGHFVVTLDVKVIPLWLANGARDLAELMKPLWAEEIGPTGLILANFPELVDVLRPEARDAARCQSVTNLRLLVADDASSVPCFMWNGVLFFDTKQLFSLSRSERLGYLLSEAEAAGWLIHDAKEALCVLGDARVDELRAHIAAGSSLGERLLRAVGNRNEPLLASLGIVGLQDILQRITPTQLAELVLAQLGPATLTTLRETLDAEGLKPPSRWNTSEARAFVASLGFPDDFAASPESHREAEEYISGPIELPALHDFQREVLDGISDLVRRNSGRRRAVISLPTGGGKTRVTVEAAVRLVLEPKGSQRSVIWVAQTDELCEQAVQAFRQVWINLGALRTDLRIVRLWGGNPNPAPPDMDKPIVVVASIQTLNSRMGTEGLAWLRNPGLVVVDECHHAITPSYTNLLRFLDAEVHRTNEQPKYEPPILGLSATPFRPDDVESRRLAQRFDNRWLPAQQEDLHRRLTQQGVLADVDLEPLPSGIDLTSEELERLSALEDRWEGIDFENLLESINQRLAGDQQRNERLVNRIVGARESSILFFANSVLHAKEMAARLNISGIKAAAVSGETPTTARRYFLSQFQAGEIRVLCNHTVLSTGFDAPKTDMVLISRAVFSPIRYMQMVGRGLRGEKNGGKPRCRIVTVVDNLGRFQNRHPYHYCQSLFAQ